MAEVRRHCQQAVLSPQTPSCGPATVLHPRPTDWQDDGGKACPGNRRACVAQARARALHASPRRPFRPSAPAARAEPRVLEDLFAPAQPWLRPNTGPSSKGRRAAPRYPINGGGHGRVAESGLSRGGGSGWLPNLGCGEGQRSAARREWLYTPARPRMIDETMTGSWWKDLNT